jgi:hypothetical protein
MVADCHPEQSEGARASLGPLRYAQGDITRFS